MIERAIHESKEYLDAKESALQSLQDAYVKQKG